MWSDCLTHDWEIFFPFLFEQKKIRDCELSKTSSQYLSWLVLSSRLLGRKVLWPEWNEEFWWHTLDAFWRKLSRVSILHVKQLSVHRIFSASALWNPMWMNESNITQIPFLTIPNTARPTTYLKEGVQGKKLWESMVFYYTVFFRSAGTSWNTFVRLPSRSSL